MQYSIGKKIKQLCKLNDMPLNELAKRLDRSKQAVYDIVEKDDINTSLLRKCAEIFNVPMAYFFDNEGEESPSISIADRQKSAERIVTDAMVPLLEVEAAANLNTLVEEAHSNTTDWIHVPRAPRCDAAMRVSGDSMYPKLNSGDIIAFKVVEPAIESILFGQMYVVQMVLNDDIYIVVKTIHKSDLGHDYIKLVSENPFYQPKDVHISTVKTLALVRFSVRYDCSF